MMWVIALARAVPVSMDCSLWSAIEIETIWAPGARPFFSGLEGKLADAIDATWVPWLEASETN